MSEPRALRRFFKRRTTVASIALIAFMTLVSIAGPVLLPASFRELTSNQFSPPSCTHPFGTDLNGRDLFYRVIEGARISLLVGFAGALVSFIIGTAYGLVSGYAGGKIDALMMRCVEVLYSIPRLIIIIVLISAFDHQVKQLFSRLQWDALIGYSRITILILCLGLMEWLTMARIVRGQVLSLKSRQFVAAARSLGQGHFKIITLHLLPNLAGVVIVYLTLTIPAVILDESFLSFLGLGIQSPQASWGSLLSDGAQVINPIRSNWWLLVFPATAMCSTLLALNFVGDALRDALDPHGVK